MEKKRKLLMKKLIKKRLFIWSGIIIGLGALLLAPLPFLHSQTNQNFQANHQIWRQSDTASLPETATNQLKDYNFPSATSLNTNVNGENVTNLYNVNGQSILYAQTKSNLTKTDTNKKYDALVALKTENNAVAWAINTRQIQKTIETERTSKSITNYTINSINLNQVLYSPTSRSYYLNVTASGTKTNNSSTAENVNNTVILKIVSNDGNLSVSVLFDGAGKTNITSSAGTNYADTSFGQFVISLDGSVPVFLLIKNQFEPTTSSSTIQEFVVLQVAGANVQVMTSSALNASDKSALTGSKKAYITNSFYLNQALVLLYRLYDPDNPGSANKSYFYAFSLNGNNLNTPTRTSVSGLGANAYTNFVFWDYMGPKLIMQQNGAVGSNFSSQGKLSIVSLNATVNGNNATLTTTTNTKEIKYFNQANLTTIAPTILNNTGSSVPSTSSLLPPKAAYVAVNQNKVLVALDANFKYLDQIASLNLIPTDVKILRIINTGVQYLIFLSNGQIMVYNNAGFVSYLSKLTTNGFESIAPISFARQDQIFNGALVFTKNQTDFEADYKQNWNNYIKYASSSRSQPVYDFSFKFQPSSNTDHSSVVTVTVNQKLRPLNASGQVDTSKSNSASVYVGQQNYYLYNNNSSVIFKTFDQLRSGVKNNLPSLIQSYYSQSAHLQEAIDEFLTLSGVDTKDLSNNSNNVTLSFNPDDSKGTLGLSVILAHGWKDNQKASFLRFDYSYTGFRTINPESELVYTLNPLDASRIPAKYLAIAPQDLTIEDVNNTSDFIRLTPFLKANLQKSRTSILPDEISGSAIITVYFNFGTNPFLKLKNVASAINVTRDSVTWKTHPIFVKNPNLNDAMLLKFNTLAEIQASNKKSVAGDKASTISVINKKPSELVTELNAKKTIGEKNELVQKQWKLFTASTFVDNLITNIQIINQNDLTGSFALNITLSKALTNSLQTSYQNFFSGFGTQNPTDSDIYTVSFSNKSSYIRKFSPPSPQNLFNLLPSNVRKEDLIERNGSDLSTFNKILGGIITMSSQALSANYQMDLTSNDQSGELLVSFLFSDFIEKSADGSVKLVRNKRIVHTLKGFREQNTNTDIIRSDLYYLNWKGSTQLKAAPSDASGTPKQSFNLSETFASQYAKQLSINSKTKLDLAKHFVDFSSFALNKYASDPNLIDITVNGNDNFGVLTVQLTLQNWNNSNGLTIFTQNYGGFLVNKNAFDEAIRTFNPLVSPQQSWQDSELKLHLNPNDLSKLFSFNSNNQGVNLNVPIQPNILNNLDKKIFFFYNNTTGDGEFVFFIKKPNWPDGGSAPTSDDSSSLPVTRLSSSTNKIDSTKEFQLNSKTTLSILRFQDASSGASNVKAEKIFNQGTLNALRQTWNAQGYVELSPSIPKLIPPNLFKKVSLFADSSASSRNLILAVVLPLLILLPMVIFLFIYRRSPKINYLIARLYFLLNEREREKKSSPIKN